MLLRPLSGRVELEFLLGFYDFVFGWGNYFNYEIWRRHGIDSAQCTVGEESVWSAFSSTATTVDVMKDFLGTTGARTLFQLTLMPGAGRSFKDFSFFPNENEVLLPPNTEFKVVSKVDLGSELTMVQLEQIESDDMIIDLSPQQLLKSINANNFAI